jgi:hypothetical protein
VKASQSVRQVSAGAALPRSSHQNVRVQVLPAPSCPFRLQHDTINRSCVVPRAELARLLEAGDSCRKTKCRGRAASFVLAGSVGYTLDVEIRVMFSFYHYSLFLQQCINYFGHIGSIKA